MTSSYHYRTARGDDRAMLEALQRRSSLANEEDRAALLADPGLIDLPPEHVTPRHGVMAVASHAARGFYESCGLRYVGEVPTQLRMAVLMRPELSAAPGAG
ncbi:MAG TPA: hypothetical protein VFP48_03255 [Steroidobacteraceae bacterium]|nr:hypothetical protein [Steroidobacteraceae bacterium]